MRIAERQAAASQTVLKRGQNKTVQSDDEVKRKISSKISLALATSRLYFHKDRLKTPKYQNTYRLDPFIPFKAEAVDRIVTTILEDKLSDVEVYNFKQASKLCMEIAADILKAVVKKDYDRCKLVVQASIVQRMNQSVQSAFQCLWNEERDNYSYHVFENHRLHAWCCVFGTYYE